MAEAGSWLSPDTQAILLLCGALPQPATLMNRAEFHRHVGVENILPSVDAALTRARQLHASRPRPLASGL